MNKLRGGLLITPAEAETGLLAYFTCYSMVRILRYGMVRYMV